MRKQNRTEQNRLSLTCLSVCTVPVSHRVGVTVDTVKMLLNMMTTCSFITEVADLSLKLVLVQVRCVVLTWQTQSSRPQQHTVDAGLLGVTGLGGPGEL